MTSLTTSNAEIATQPPCAPAGSGGAWASAALALLNDDTTSPASRRLASAHAALGTRPLVLPPRAVRGGIFTAQGPGNHS